MKSMVIVVDMQNGFVRYEQTKILLEKIKQLLSLNVFDVVIGTKFLNASNSMYTKMFGWKRLMSEQEQKIPQELLQYMDYVEEKYIYNCINPSFIQRICQLNDGVMPKEIFLVGADTDCCVLTIATALFEHNIRPIVLTHYCDSNGGASSHQAGLLSMKRLIGQKQMLDCEILTKEDVLSCMNEKDC